MAFQTLTDLMHIEQSPKIMMSLWKHCCKNTWNSTTQKQSTDDYFQGKYLMMITDECYHFMYLLLF